MAASGLATWQLVIGWTTRNIPWNIPRNILWNIFFLNFFKNSKTKGYWAILFFGITFSYGDRFSNRLRKQNQEDELYPVV